MFRGLIDLWGTAAERLLRECLFGAATVGLAVLFAIVSLGFGTFAAYLHLRALHGGVVAALIVGAAFGIIAVSIWVFGAVRRHGRRRHPVALAPTPSAKRETPVAPAAAGSSQEQIVLATAMRLGRELSPMQLLALALIGGFIAGRKLDK